MVRYLLRNITLYTRTLVHSSANVNSKIPNALLAPVTASNWHRLRFYSPEFDSSSEKPNPLTESSALENFRAKLEEFRQKDGIKDVRNKELKELLEKYFNEHNEEVLPSIMEAIMQQKLCGNNEETNDELMKKLMDDKVFDMDNKKWDPLIKEATEQGFLKDMRECEEFIEDMLHGDKLLPDDIKERVEKKFNELGDICERGGLEPEEAYKLFKQYEDEMVMEHGKRLDAEGPPQFDETEVPNKKKDSDGPPGEGPILRWQTQVIFSPGDDQWHPKNRLVKMSVTVKELGLSKHRFQRLRELVGKRYHPGRDELTITSERFEHREENRKDCLRTLYALLEEAGKADKLAEDARVTYVKDRLRANPAFMNRLRAKVTRQGSNTTSA